MKNLISTVYVFLLFISHSAAQLTVVTSNLVSPAGVEVDNSGNAWVTETGTGKNDGRVLIVRPNGDKIPVIVNLSSSIHPTIGDVNGAWRSMFLPNNRLAVIVGEGLTTKFGRILIFNLTGFSPGQSTPKTETDAVSSIDGISTFAFTQPGVVSSNPFSAALDAEGNWYVADAGANMIIKIATNGQKSVFAKFPPIPNPTPIGPPVMDYVPTKIIANPDGGFYVCNLSGFPFLDGKASIVSIDKNGNISPYAKGLTLLTDIVLDNRTGDLYAMQFGSFVFPTPGFVFGSGKVHRIQRGGAYSEVVASNFGPGSGLALDASGNIYVTSLFTSQLLKMNSTPCNNLDVSITADNNSLTLYSSIKYTLKITNKGSTNATNVRVFWLPPYKRFEGDNKPFAYQAAYASKGHYDSWHGYWTIENLAPGESATANFHLFVVNDKQDATQSAQVVACNQRFQNFSKNDATNYQVQIVTKKGDKDNDESIQISPNPAYDNINMTITNATEGIWVVKLLNSMGQIVNTQTGQNSRTIYFDASNLNNGLYLVEYQSEDVHRVEKVLIQH